jgi:hypothetical protein
MIPGAFSLCFLPIGYLMAQQAAVAFDVSSLCFHVLALCQRLPYYLSFNLARSPRQMLNAQGLG